MAEQFTSEQGYEFTETGREVQLRKAGMRGILLVGAGPTGMALKEYVEHVRKEAAAQALAQRDAELGRWRDPEDPDYVVKIDPFSARIAHILHEPSLCTRVIHEGDDSDDLFDSPRVLTELAVADRYFAAHPARPAWADAEVISWRTPNGAVPWIAQQDIANRALSASGNNWLPAYRDDGWLTEAQLAELIGDAEVIVLVPKGGE